MVVFEIWKYSIISKHSEDFTELNYIEQSLLKMRIPRIQTMI